MMTRVGFLRTSGGAGVTAMIAPYSLLTTTPDMIVAELDAAWAVFLENRSGGRGNWTQDQRWRADNPGEWVKLLAYRDGTGPRPSLASEPGRRMVFETPPGWPPKPLSRPRHRRRTRILCRP